MKEAIAERLIEEYGNPQNAADAAFQLARDNDWLDERRAAERFLKRKPAGAITVTNQAALDLIVAWHGAPIGNLTHDGFEWRWKASDPDGPPLVGQITPGRLPPFIEALVPEGWLNRVLNSPDERAELCIGKRYLSNITIVERVSELAALPADILLTRLNCFAANHLFTGNPAAQPTRWVATTGGNWDSCYGMDASLRTFRMKGQLKEEVMTFELLAIDLGKSSFHLHSIASDGTILSRKVSRSKLAEIVKAIAPKTVAMEACASAHHWGRQFKGDGREVLLINPRFVKPFVRGSKNDAVDAAAIYEAATRPTTRFVPLKSAAQQDLQSLHRIRERLIVQRTSLINHARGLLAEYGIVLPQGPWRFASQAPSAVKDAALSDLGRELFLELLDQLTDVNDRVGRLDRKISEICRERDDCRRLSELPGVGPIIATAIVASVEDGRHFKSGRELAAWIGLIPRQYSTGGKPRLGGIGRRANHYLRRQMIHGARAVISRLASHDDRRSQWLKELVARRGFNKAIVALANKTARIAWALLTRQERYLAQ